MKQYPNFDGVVFFYDFLKKIVFGNSLDKAQAAFLSYIPSKASVLIIGGGTGEILLDMSKSASVKDITYLEYSDKMLVAAKRRMDRLRNASEGTFEITFIKGSVEILDPTVKYDVVVTPFVLDVIEPDELGEFMKAINNHIRPAGYWLFADFCKSSSNNLISYYNTFLIKSMFLFFDLTTGLKANDLPDFDAHFLDFGYTMLASKSFHRGIIQSKVWQKTNDL